MSSSFSLRDPLLGARGRFSRRGFLELGAAAAITVVIAHAPGARAASRASVPAPEDAARNDLRFPLGVASGDVTSSTAVLWTRVEGVVPVRCTVWAFDASLGLQEVASIDAAPDASGAVHVEVAGLAAGTEHRFAFYDGDTERSRLGRFTTSPPDDFLAPVSFGACSCTKNGFDMGVMGRAGRRTDLSFFVHLGDTVYADGSRSLDDYRAKWTQNLSTAGYRDLRASTSVIATWDDHEVSNNWNPETFDPTLVAAARQAFFENMPLDRASIPSGRIWKKKRWGKTVELFVLDSRSDRRTSGATDQYLSREQMDWLKRGLLESDAVFKVIVNSVPISEFPSLFQLFRSDRWEAFPAQRNEILGYIDGSQIPGVLWIAGDLHLASVGRISQAGFGRTAQEVLLGPGAQLPNVLAGMLGGTQFDWASAENNYGALHLDPDKGTARVVHHGRDGGILADHTLQLA